MRLASRSEETRKHPVAVVKGSSHPLNADLQIIGNSYHFSWCFSKAALQNQVWAETAEPEWRILSACCCVPKQTLGS
ncbi:hypothetical protein GRJ2_001391700 [Grus japonensis]|uniref:Uncharacterized protein n=1 Tax=Grus japonensis TaxID=30415 RepID=A0ABC9WWT7_GRUJA